MTYITNPTNGTASSGNTISNQVIGGVTTLTADVTSIDTSITVDDTSSYTAGQYIKINSEYLLIDSVTNATTLAVTREQFDSSIDDSDAHLSGDTVSGVYIGTSEQSQKPDVMVSMTSTESATEYFDFSNDNSTWSTFPVLGFNVTTNIHEFHTAVKGPRYFRIRIVNTSSSPSTLNVNTYFGVFKQGNLPLNQSIGDDIDTKIVRSVLVGKEPDNTYVNQRQTCYAIYDTTNLDSGNNYTYTSSIIDCSGYTQISTELYADQSGVLTGTWYNDSAGQEASTVRTFNFFYTNGDNLQVFSAPVFTKYLKYSFTTTDQTTTNFLIALKLQTNAISGQILGLTSYVAQNMVASLSRSIITGQLPNAQFQNVPLDSIGHLETAIHGPLLPFGSVHTENITPVLQADGVYSLNPLIYYTVENGGGSASTVDSSLVCETTSASFGNATIQTKKRLKYKAGQGSIMRFTAQFTDPTQDINFDDSTDPSVLYQVAGFGHAEDGYYFCYKGLDFGILHVNRAYRHIETLTISAGATGAGNLTVTLNSVNFTVPLTTANPDPDNTTAENIAATAYEIANFDYNGWNAQQVDDTVIFIAGSSGNKTGTFSIANDTSAGVTSSSFTTTRAGDTGTETFIEQSTWNIDVMDGTSSLSNPSGVLLDPSKYNIYQIGMQFLGVGSIQFHVIIDNIDNNNTWTPIHSIRNPNTLTATHIGNPSLPYTLSAYKTGASDINLIVKTASMLGGVEGNVKRHGPRISFSNNSSTAIAAGNKSVLFIIKNSLIYNGIPNQTVIHLRSINAAAVNGNNNMTSIYLVKNIEELLTSTTFNFTEFSASKSCSLWDNNVQSITAENITENIIYTLSLSIDGNGSATFDSQSEDYDLQPGDTVAVVVESFGAASTDNVIASLNIREDQ